jgi:transcriptional regulator with XRE-family HTH domain
MSATDQPRPTDLRNLSARRNVAGMTQERLATASGLSLSYIRLIEKGYANYSPDAAARILAALSNPDMSIDDHLVRERDAAQADRERLATFVETHIPGAAVVRYDSGKWYVIT